MDDGGRATAAARGDAPDASAAEGAAQYASLVRGPRIVAIGAAGTAASTMAFNLFGHEGFSGLLLAVSVPAAVLCVLVLRNLVNFSGRSVARLRHLAGRLGGTFSLWKPGTGGHRGMGFDHGLERQRFGVMTGALRGVPIEMGHVASKGSSGHRGPGVGRHGYVVFRLPERLPHMVVSFGRYASAFGVRVAPDEWHRSQLLDVGGGRRFRLFVADGGEVVARSFFRPEMVELLTRVGRSHDVEILDRSLYLLASRSPAAGSERRWADEQRLLEELAGALADTELWERLPRLSQRRRGGQLQKDTQRALAVFFGIVAGICVVISILVLWSMGFIG